MLFNINIVFKKIDSLKIYLHSHIFALRGYVKYNCTNIIPYANFKDSFHLRILLRILYF